MLVLTRKNREAIVVGECGGNEQVLKVTVLEVRSGSVKLGFEANVDVPIHRAEVWDRIHGVDGAVDPESSEPHSEYRQPYYN
jgi:carbon storage regulator